MENLYLGVSQEKWDQLCSTAENVMLDLEIGQHLVGVYPFGNRIYGLPDEPIGLLCICINDPHSLLDPYNTQVKEPVYTSIEEGNIKFVELFSWIKWIINNNYNGSFDRNLVEFIHVIPAMFDAQYEDLSISNITSLLKNYLQDKKYDSPYLMNPIHFTEYKKLVIHALYLRTRFILETKGIFAPCLNRNWDTVENISLDTNEQLIDNELVKNITNSEITISEQDLILYCNWFITHLNRESGEQLFNILTALESAKKLGKECKNLLLKLL
jgi:hypothetical protein